MHNCIEINDVCYKNIFNNLNMKIQKNKLTSISGSNNSGKTLLIKTLTKNITVDGTINIFDNNINNYKVTDYYKIVKGVIPEQEYFVFDNVEDEINFYINQLFLSKEEKNKRLKNIKKNLNLNRLKKKKISELLPEEMVLFQIGLAISQMPKVLLIDDLTEYLSTDEIKKTVEYFRYLIKNYDITIVLISTRLEDILGTDYIYVLDNGKVVIEGKPEEVIQKDNILNKAGLRLPFMIDLSVKLKDYNLIDDIELDMNRMIEELWS